MREDVCLPRLLDITAERYPELSVILFDRRGGKPESRTVGEVLASARRSAARIAGLGIGEGDRVVVALPTSWEWFDAWLGCLIRGALPLATAPALTAGRDDAQLRRISQALDLIGGRALVCRGALKTGLAAAGEERLAAAAVTPEEIADQTPPAGWSVPEPEPGETAFLQLTSGSTGLSRAVMVPHRAVGSQAWALDEVVGAPWGERTGDHFDAFSIWLPLYHDMGLIGGMTALLMGMDLRLFPAQAFLGRPRRWLEDLGSAGVTLSAGPNFGYQLCVERLRDADLSGLDLSGFQAGLVGSEMIRSETLDAFIELFGPYGFSPGSFRPCYGLAEGTLAVTFDRGGRGYRSLPLPSGIGAGLGLTDVVSCGAPLAGTKARIVAPDGGALGEGEVGEVCLRGPCIFSGYYNDPQATAETLIDGWLHTGDLGFLDRGELFLTGRSKELLIVRGQNLMPHELEWQAESVTGGGGALRAVAFSVAGGADGEQAVLVLEAGSRDPEALQPLADAVRSRIGRGLGLPVADVVFVRRGKIPKTTSGKVRRAETRRLYLDGSLERLSG